MFRKNALASVSAIVLGLSIVAPASGAPSVTASDLVFGPVQQLVKALRHEQVKQTAAHAAQIKRRNHVLPYSGGGRRWALPYHVAICEGGGRFDNHSGAYGIIDQTWNSFGGQKYAPYPGAATPWQQAVITAKVRDYAGPSGWSCW